MNKADGVLIVLMLLFAAGLILFFQYWQTANTPENANAYVYYNNTVILSIDLSDGSPEIYDDQYVVNVEAPLYTVSGTNGDVIIEYRDGSVRVIEEISPKNICQLQGWSNSPFVPITCLPNNIVIIIEGGFDESAPDVITG
jgi:hypothetical protein